jgi:hypothetical protein
MRGLTTEGAPGSLPASCSLGEGPHLPSLPVLEGEEEPHPASLEDNQCKEGRDKA